MSHELKSSANAFDPAAVEPERYELLETPQYRFEVTRRSLFRALGAGLLVFVLSAESDAQESGRPGGRRGGGQGRSTAPNEIGAWLHFGENGLVTAHTGKAEVGQNIRTSLSQAVAEELRIPLASVTLVMADTDLTPYDMGTFGSRTTPTMAPIMHRAAAAAREALLELAAAEWQVDLTALSTAGGKITHAAGHREMSYAQLLKDRKLTHTIDGAAVTPPQNWTVAGTSALKVDAHALVTGRHAYTSDIRRDGMVYGKVIRPPAWNAVPKGVGGAPPGITVLKDGSFIGITAPTSHAAEKAAAMIKVEWETAAAAQEETLWERLRGGTLRPVAEGSPGRLAATFTVAYIAHAPLEPRAAVAEWQGDRLQVWTGTQRPFGVRSDLAQAFGIPESQVRVITPDTGSGYGGKHTGEAAVEAARLAKACGKPVKLIWTREEEFNWAYFRPAGVIDAAGTVAPDGLLTEWEFHNFNSGSSGLPTPYDVAKRTERFHNADSPLRQGSYRGLAGTANHFAREAMMDDLARSVKMDPLDFRLKNLKDDRMRAVLETAAKRFGWARRAAGHGRGYGLAIGSEKGSFIANCVEVAVDRAAGRVIHTRITAAFECGAVVNPLHLQNQVEGATVMGIGGALFEAIHFDQGRVTNGRFSRYRVPRFSDVPEIDVVLVDRKDIPSAGAGETPIMAIAPAIRNAILDATGLRFDSLPMLPNGLPKA